MPESAPLFFALAVPAEVRAMAGRFQEAAQRLGPARCPGLEGLHITLAFLGRTEAAQVPALLALAEAAAAPVARFSLRTAGTGGFPRPARARIFWVGFVAEPALAALDQRFRAALKSGGIPFDEKPFMPHLTLARFREPVDLDRAHLPPLDPVAFSVAEVSLFQSVPVPGGMRYQALGNAPFSG